MNNFRRTSGSAMQSYVEYLRLDAKERRKMTKLELPPREDLKPKAPSFGVLDIRSEAGGAWCLCG